MRTITIARIGDVDRLVLQEMPDLLPGEGEVAIAVEASGINFADVLARVGLYAQAPRPPFVPGFEVAGRVSELGDGVTDLSVGDAVVALTPFGGYADRIVVPAMAVCRVPGGLSMTEAAALPVVGVTAWHALLVQGGLAPGETVLVQAAAGGVGLSAVQLARTVGARVIGSCGGTRKASFLRDFGVADVIDYQNEDLAVRIRDLTGTDGLDVILDSVGSGFVRTGMSHLSPGGRFVAIGAASFAPARTRSLFQLIREYLKVPRLHPLTLIGQSKSYIGVQMLVIGRRKPAVLQQALHHVMAEADGGRLRPVIDTVFPAHRIGEAHRRLQSRQSIGKLVIEW